MLLIWQRSALSESKKQIKKENCEKIKSDFLKEMPHIYVNIKKLMHHDTSIIVQIIVILIFL